MDFSQPPQYQRAKSPTSGVRTLLAMFCLVFFLPGNALAQPSGTSENAFVGANATNCSAPGTNTNSCIYSPAAGDLVIVDVLGYAGHTATVTDNGTGGSGPG